MDCSLPGFLVLHHLLDFSRTHVHWVSDAIQSSHPLLPPSPTALTSPNTLFWASKSFSWEKPRPHPSWLLTVSVSQGLGGTLERMRHSCLWGHPDKLMGQVWAAGALMAPVSIFYILNDSREKKNQKKDVLWCMEMTWDSNFSVPR